MNTTDAAALVGLSPVAFRKAMSRARARGVDLRAGMIDGRTPDWDEAALREWATTRPGRRRQ